ncbi:DUF6156 family protein [Rhodoblastus sphagnicola]|uniref:DUF6156 family protein n=1 Tax=Rhodoblastus sphagnicola TaxID=333368 RepID=UPI003CC87412
MSAADPLLRSEKIVYGDIEVTCVHAYKAAGAPRRAEIFLPDEDPAVRELN